MDPRPRILDILRDCDDIAADQALVAGLLHVPPDHQREIVHILLERAKEPALRALPAMFDKLAPGAQNLLLQKTSRLYAALRACIRSSRGQTRLNTLDIIRRSGSLRLAYLGALAIHDGSPSVRAEAAVTLQQLAAKHCHNYSETTAALRDAAEPDGSLSYPIVQTLKLLRDERKYIVAAIDEALNSYESHHRPEIVEAAMFLADELEEALFQQSTLKRGKLTHAMLEIFTGSPSPQLASFTYVAMRYPELRRRIVAALAKYEDAEFFHEFIRLHWLARDPDIRKNLLAIRDLAWLQDGLEIAFSLPEDIVALAPSWLISLGLSSDKKISLLLNFLLVDSVPANHAAVAAILGIDTPASTLALQGILDHEDRTIADMARREIDSRERRQQATIRKPRKGRPDEWSNMLDRAGLDESFDDFWNHFDRLHPIQTKAAGHHAFDYVPGFKTQIQLKFLSSQPTDRLRALRLVIGLRVVTQFQNDIFSTTNDPIPEIREAAMTALGLIGDATSRRILERALADENHTVQACAIDALDAIGVQGRDQLIAPKTNSDEPSVRAAAIRALLKMHLPQAAADLISMLKDPRVEHRCGALWIIDQLRITSLVPRVRELQETDRDPRIASIAKHVGKRLRRVQGTSDQAQRAGSSRAGLPAVGAVSE